MFWEVSLAVHVSHVITFGIREDGADEISNTLWHDDMIPTSEIPVHGACVGAVEVPTFHVRRIVVVQHGRVRLEHLTILNGMAGGGFAVTARHAEVKEVDPVFCERVWHGLIMTPEVRQDGGTIALVGTMSARSAGAARAAGDGRGQAGREARGQWNRMPVEMAELLRPSEQLMRSKLERCPSGGDGGGGGERLGQMRPDEMRDGAARGSGGS